MFEPVIQLLDRGKVRIEIDVVHYAQIARGVMINDAAGVQALDDGFGAQGQLDVARAPPVAAFVNPVNHVRVHVLLVTVGVVAHDIHDHGRMIPRRLHVERRVPGIAVVLVRVGGGPVVVAEVRLSEAHEHAHIVRRAENFRKTQVGARLATVVVRVNVVDAETLEPFQALAGGGVGGQGRAHLRIVQRNGRKKNSRAVEVEIAAINPEFAESEPLRPIGVQHLAAGGDE